MSRKGHRRRPAGKRRSGSRDNFRKSPPAGRHGRSAAREKDRKLVSLEDEIVGFIHSRGGSATRREIAEGLPPASRGHRKVLDHTLKALCLGKTLACKGDVFRNHHASSLVEARISSHPRGFAFARPVGETGDSRENDIFIPPGASASANHGDLALVRVTREKGGRREGRVIRVISRATTAVVGTFRDGLVDPEDDRLIYRVRIAAGNEGGAKAGDVVVAEILDFAPTGLNPTGRVLKVLGQADDPAVQTEIVIHIHGLPHEFSPEALAESESLDGKIVPETGRADLRELAHFTIDGETARDFDDAVAIEKLKDGFRLYVSIADVSHYVRPGTTLDREAYQRGTSVYFPGRVIPMLPERLSNGLCSLVPDQDRYAFTATLDLSSQGKIVASRFGKSLIRSRQRFTYTTVFAILSSGPRDKLRQEYSDFVEDLELMAKLAAILEKNRMRRGSIGFEIPEPEITLDDEGRIGRIVRSQRNRAHKLIEEFMLAANEAVAATFSRLDEPARFDFLYRIHEKPDPLKVEEFVDFTRRMGLPLAGSPDDPAWFAKIIESVKGSPREYIISNLMLRTMQQARYSPDNAGHFGLAAPDYCHFTSPIRRYPDLMVHRALQQLVASEKPSGKRPRPVYASAEEAGTFLSERERVAVDADREMVERLQVRYMAERIGEEFEGIISGIASFGVFVELLESFIGGAIPIADLAGDYFEIDEKNHRVTGRHSGKSLQIGDQVRVRVSEVNVARRRINFQLVES